jgi:N-acetylmuramoyl-L-alanine amidase
MRKIGREVTRKSEGPTVAEESRQRLRDSEHSGGLVRMKPETIPLPKCRMIQHDSHRAAFNRFPLAKAGIVTVKLRTFGFLAVVLVGLLFSSCAVTPRRAAISGAAELGATQDIIPPDKCGRPLHRPMRPTFITIHSTDNTSRSANALNHALAMNKGLRGSHNRTGFLTWHFTVDDHSIYQTLPTNETGEHADYEGQGNRSSIGIEMCVNRGNNLDITIDRTAQLTARLMRQYNIPLDHVVPHMHWRMIRYDDGRDLGFKQCPRILLDGGRLGPKWNAFIAKVSLYAR